MNCPEHCTELPKYYVRLQMAAARSLGLPASRLAGHHTDAAPKHSLCYFSYDWTWSVQEASTDCRTLSRRSDLQIM